MAQPDVRLHRRRCVGHAARGRHDLDLHADASACTGVVGVKSGFTTAAGGCDVVAVDRRCGGRPVLVLAAVTGQTGERAGRGRAARLALVDARPPLDRRRRPCCRGAGRGRTSSVAGRPSRHADGGGRRAHLARVSAGTRRSCRRPGGRRAAGARGRAGGDHGGHAAGRPVPVTHCDDGIPPLHASPAAALTRLA